MMSEEELRKEADKIAKDKAGWMVHFGIYLIVNVFVIITWLLTSGIDSYPWFIWMTGGWGVGVAGHFIAVYLDVGMKEKLRVKEYEKLKKLQEK